MVKILQQQKALLLVELTMKTRCPQNLEDETEYTKYKMICCESDKEQENKWRHFVLIESCEC